MEGSCLDAALADLSGFKSNRISYLIPLEIMSSTSDNLMVVFFLFFVFFSGQMWFVVSGG